MCNTPCSGSPSHLMRRLRSRVSFFFPLTRTYSGGIHHRGMGCNKYEHQCRTTDTSTRACPGRLSQGCVSDPRRPLRFELWMHQSPVNNFFFLCGHGCVFGWSWHEKILIFLTCFWLCINDARSQIISQNCFANTQRHFASPSNEATWQITVQVVWEPLPI